MDRGDVIARLKTHRPELEALGVRRMYLFGSVARDAAGAGSDVDVMVDLDEGAKGRKPMFSAFDVGGIQHALTRILGRDVDLVVRADAMKPGKRLRSVAKNQLIDVF